MGKLLWTLALSAACLAAPAAPRPNLILIVADDLGYETLGCNGSTSYRTPNLDRLAATGARFTHCFVQPLCTPTRVQLMTGLYNVRNYVRFGWMDPNSRTFAHPLQRAGYATCVAGKWQLGRDPDLPKKFGFDAACLWQHTRRPPRYANPGLEFDGVERDFNNGEYGPDLVHEFVCDFIRRHRDRPFFVYYPMMLTHAPFQPTPDSPDWDPKARGENVNRNPKYFADMVQYMDKLIGQLLAHLESLHLRTNTLILFTADNGTPRGIRSRCGDRIIEGGKGRTTATGMHVPLIANWPARIRPGQTATNLVDSTDFFPTLLDAAGLKPPADLALDGVSFLPQLLGRMGPAREWIYSWYSPRLRDDRLVREFAFDHRFKLYRSGDLFDWASDPDEQKPLPPNDRSDAATAAVKKLQAALDRFKDARPARMDAPDAATE
ncbi:MAG: sulfatase-like hydrolase/transferase [Verrucomicrobiales bacterium]|nr:sulfatase-like hydrolase/transferase [Verrucomicrobiales bacterium]